MENPKRRLATVEQMAEILQVPKSWLYHRTRQGQEAIPHVKLGLYVRFDPDEVIKFFKFNGNRAIMNPQNTETTNTNENSHYFRSSREISHQDSTSSISVNARFNQRKTSKDKPAKSDLVDRRTLSQEVHLQKVHSSKESPQEKNLINSPNTAILFSDTADNSDKGD